jgi:SdpI/YfhL protein family
MEVLGPALVLVSIPLLFRWVPRNCLYGFRVAATLRDDTVWYDVNARGARHLLILGSVMIASEFVLPRSLRDVILSSIAAIGLAATTVVCWRRANRLAKQLSV